MNNEDAINIIKHMLKRYPCSLESNFSEEVEQIALNVAIEALEKGIYKAPYQEMGAYYTGMGYTYYYFLCPSCNCVLEPEPKGLERMRKAEKGRCFSCGQILDWSKAKRIDEED